MVKKEWIEKGYVTEPIDSSLDLKAEISLGEKGGRDRRQGNGDVWRTFHGGDLQALES